MFMLNKLFESESQSESESKYEVDMIFVIFREFNTMLKIVDS